MKPMANLLLFWTIFTLFTTVRSIDSCISKISSRWKETLEKTPTNFCTSKHFPDYYSNNVDTKRFILGEDNQTSKVQHRKLLVVGIASARNHFHQRMALRKAWKTIKGTRWESLITFQFLIGAQNSFSDKDKSVEAMLLKESQTQSDILFLPVFDTYKNVILKTLHFADNTLSNFDFDFFLKMDDDTLLDILTLAQELEQRLLISVGQNISRVYRGLTWTGKPVRSKKHKNSLSLRSYPLDVFIPYAHGAAYILSKDLVEYIVFNETFLVNSLWDDEDDGAHEDSVIGLWMFAIGVKVEHESRFSIYCRFESIALFDVPMKCMESVVYQMQNKDTMCAPCIRYHTIEKADVELKSITAHSTSPSVTTPNLQMLHIQIGLLNTQGTMYALLLDLKSATEKFSAAALASPETESVAQNLRFVELWLRKLENIENEETKPSICSAVEFCVTAVVNAFENAIARRAKLISVPHYQKLEDLAIKF